MITIFGGCMGSGKTENLIKTYNLTKEDKKNNVLLVKSILDRQKTYVQSRNGLKALANLVLKSNEVGVIDCTIREKNITDCFIDEAQFFDYDLVYLVQNNTRVNFYLSGIETDYQKKPLGFLGVIRKLCKHEYIYFDITCQNCNKFSAEWNYRLVKGQGVILVGDKEYKSVCSMCYDVLDKGDLK